ncbi:hypothetical protein Fcan01_24180 [Folsomia candida]|uniref:EB domain-containing protein n=1 Tax=Folsomia candida TaxID=158441 RepID=A0A226D677_FOLCA|nr:hypothetical protein Fcan01_24180 [Folsomia candida]
MELTFIFVALVQFSSCVSSISTPPLIPSPNDPDVNLDLPDFNKPCNKTTCKPGQFCTNGLCACANPSYEIYNKVTGRCDRVVGAVCTDHNVCAKGAVCIRKHFERQTPSSASLYGYRVTEITANICRCPAGWVENINHGCDLAYGQICGGEDLVGVKCDRNGEFCSNLVAICKRDFGNMTACHEKARTIECIGPIGKDFDDACHAIGGSCTIGTVQRNHICSCAS